MQDTAGEIWEELISDVLVLTPLYGRARRPATNYTQQLSADMGCSPKDIRELWTMGTGGERGSGISVLIA